MPVQKLSSNRTKLSIADEVRPGVLPHENDPPTATTWYELEPNSYGEFGSENELEARAPITDDRQRRKSVVISSEANGEFEHDFTFGAGLATALSSFAFADFRNKGVIGATAVTNTGYTVPSGGDAFRSGDIIAVTGARLAANNGVKIVTSNGSAGNVPVTGLTASAGETIRVQKVGFSFAAGDLVLDATTGGYPVVIATAKNLSQLGLIPGEIVFLGGDGANDRFTAAGNNGWCRVLSVTDTRITFDKTDMEMSDEDGAGKTIKLYFGRILRNEVGQLLKTKTVALERQLGAPELSAPTQKQAEYLRGCYPSELDFMIPDRGKITLDLAFMAMDHTIRKYSEGLIAGTRVDAVEEDAFNSGDHVKRMRLSVYPTTSIVTSAPDALFAVIEEASFSVVNNIEPNYGIKYRNAFAMTEGMLELDGEITAYFATVDAVQAIRDNADTTLDFAMYRNHIGFAVDFPMISFGGGGVDVEMNEAIKMSIDAEASKGSKYNAAMNHTFMFVFFDYLPTLAARRVD